MIHKTELSESEEQIATKIVDAAYWVVCELKAVDVMPSVNTAQLLTYLKLTGKRLGFLINFNVSVFKQGIKRVVL